MKAGVLGWPIRHSLSPDIFRRLAAETGVPMDYRRLAVRPERLESAVARLRAQGYAGFNVTIPHKEAVAAFLAGTAPEASAIGAVNAVKLEDGYLVGHNTDAEGFLDALRERRVRLAGAEAVVFGAGGAARAAAYALGRARVRRATIVNRHRRRAADLARDMGRLFPGTRFAAAPRAPAAKGITVNATPLGMEGFPQVSPAHKGWVPGAWAYDLVYRPAATPFLRQAAAGGARVIGGLDMLVYQALRSWELWVRPLSPADRRGLKRKLFGALGGTRCLCDI